MLFNYLSKHHYKKYKAINTWSFPDYESSTGEEIKQYLNGNPFGHPVEYLHILYAANRYEWKKVIEKGLNLGVLSIFNRYYQSNIAYGVAHGLDHQWLEDLDKYMPQSDLTIILDVPVGTSSNRNKNPDKNESDIGFMKKVRKNFLYLADRYGWIVVKANRDKDKVHQDIVELVNIFLSEQ